MTRSREAFGAILAKDLRTELRTFRSLSAMALFAITTFVIFRFGLDRTTPVGEPRGRRSLGNPAVRRDPRDQQAVRRRARGRRLRRDPAGADRPHRFCSARRRRAVAYLLVLERSRCPSSPLFFLDSAAALPPLCLVLVLADFGFAATGALISSMAVNSRARDLLVPLLLLPLVVPLMIAATGASGSCSRREVPATIASAPGLRCSVYTIWSSS